MTDEQLLSKLNSIASREVNTAGKRGITGENKRAELVREALRRGLIGYPSKAKYRVG